MIVGTGNQIGSSVKTESGLFHWTISLASSTILELFLKEKMSIPMALTIQAKLNVSCVWGTVTAAATNLQSLKLQVSRWPAASLAQALIPNEQCHLHPRPTEPAPDARMINK